MGYITNFIVYTLAMVGIIGIALMVFKFSQNGGGRGKSKYLKVLDTLSIGPRKNLYIVSTGQEKFLIAGDVDRTTLISKLNSSEKIVEQISATATVDDDNFTTQSFKEYIKPALTKEEDYIDKSVVGIRKSMVDAGVITNTSYTSVMKNLATKMRGGI